MADGVVEGSVGYLQRSLIIMARSYTNVIDFSFETLSLLKARSDAEQFDNPAECQSMAFAIPWFSEFVGDWGQAGEWDPLYFDCDHPDILIIRLPQKPGGDLYEERFYQLYQDPRGGWHNLEPDENWLEKYDFLLNEYDGVIPAPLCLLKFLSERPERSVATLVDAVLSSLDEEEMTNVLFFSHCIRDSAFLAYSHGCDSQYAAETRLRRLCEKFLS